MCTQNENPSPETELPELVVGQEEPEIGFEPQEAESALAALKPTLLSLPPSELRPFPVAVAPAVGLGLAYGEAFAEDRDRFAAAIQPEEFDSGEHADLKLRAMAFWKADIQMRQELNANGPFKTLVLEAKPLRKKLLKTASFLWGDHPELGDVVLAIRKGQGYQDMADDLGALHELFTDHWGEAENQCPVTSDEVARAKVLGADILQALSPTRSKELDEAKDLRQRAAEHLRRGLEHVRDAAKYVFRRDATALERYPSLFVLRRRPRPGSSTGSEATTSVDPTPSGPTSTVEEPPTSSEDPLVEDLEAFTPDA
jgi:hypothetical protein